MFVRMEDQARRFVGITRLMIGLGAWLAPAVTVRFFGMDPERSDRFITRLFGAREVTMAAAMLAAPAAALPTVAVVEAAIDAADVVGGLDEARRGNLGTRGTLLGPVGAILFVGINLFIAKSAQDRVTA